MLFVSSCFDEEECFRPEGNSLYSFCGSVSVDRTPRKGVHCKRNNKITKIADTSFPDVQIAATQVAIKFENALTLFEKCHEGYNGGGVSDSKINDIGKYMSLKGVVS